MIMAAAALLATKPQADRRGHRRRDHQHLPLRHVPGSARRRSTPPPRRRRHKEDSHENESPLVHRQLRRRHRRPRARLRLRFGPEVVRAAGRLARDHRLGRDPARRHRSHPHGALRDGPGHDHRPRAAGAPRSSSATGQGDVPSTRRRAQSLKRKRVWGDFSTGGSRGIRTSHEYVRQGGATARVMLVQAAANQWKVPASECSGGEQRHHAQAVGPQDDLRQGRRGRRAARAAEGREAQGPEGVEAHRQAGEAARHASTR